jgi:hypothetical protein
MTAKRGPLSAQDADAISTSKKIYPKKYCRGQKINFIPLLHLWHIHAGKT